MEMNKNNRKQILIYIGASYGLFWGIFIVAIVLIQTGIIPVSLDGESAFLNFLKILISWTPTMAVYFFRKQLFPGHSVKEIFLSMFQENLGLYSQQYWRWYHLGTMAYPFMADIRLYRLKSVPLYFGIHDLHSCLVCCHGYFILLES